MDSECRNQLKGLVPDADEGAIAAIAAICGASAPADERVDLASSAEDAWLRELYCKDALHLALPDPALDAAIARVAARLAGIAPCRLTVCYCLAEELGRLDRLRAPAGDAIDTEPAHPAIGARGSAALAAAGDAVALVTGAPIASVGESIVQLGERVAEGEARLEQAVTGHGTPDGVPVRRNLIWVLVALAVFALLGWLLFSGH